MIGLFTSHNQAQANSCCLLYTSPLYHVIYTGVPKMYKHFRDFPFLKCLYIVWHRLYIVYTRYVYIYIYIHILVCAGFVNMPRHVAP
jgi:hypothetical protein